jgi:hypothetical protein
MTEVATVLGIILGVAVVAFLSVLGQGAIRGFTVRVTLQAMREAWRDLFKWIWPGRGD